MRNYIAHKLRRLAAWTENSVLFDAGRIRHEEFGKALQSIEGESWYVGSGPVFLFVQAPKWWTRIRPLPEKPKPISLDELGFTWTSPDVGTEEQ